MTLARMSTPRYKRVRRKERQRSHDEEVVVVVMHGVLTAGSLISVRAHAHAHARGHRIALRDGFPA